jgi:hypothetical protein
MDPGDTDALGVRRVVIAELSPGAPFQSEGTRGSPASATTASNVRLANAK